MTHSKSTNRPFRDESLHIAQLNCGGLTQSKKIELIKIINSNHIDVFFLMEANKKKADLDKYIFPGYSLHLLEKSRQVASGILIEIRNALSIDFKIVKQMGDSEDKMELINLNISKAVNYFSIYAVYNPPTNKPNIDFINVHRKTIIIGDFNAPSKHWGFNVITPPGQLVENFLNSTQMELFYRPTYPPTFLHYSGKGTNPDLLLVSSDISDTTTQKVIEDPGSGHRIVIASIKLSTQNTQKSKPRLLWNFTKCNWSTYAEGNINFEQHPNRICDEARNIILTAAK